MTNFEFEYSKGTGYDNKIEITVRLKKRLPKTKYDELLKAVDILQGLEFYLIEPAKK